MDKKIFVVIPTYNEAENLPPLIKQLFSLNSPDLSVLVVDDNSPDGTGEIAKRLREDYPRLSALCRPEKKGLGAAYLAGFRYLFEREGLSGRADAEESFYLVKMDADGSHRVEDLERLLKERDVSEVVVGSRYVKGGKVDYPWQRILISKSANWFANLVLGLGVKDATSGFKVYPGKVIDLFLKDGLSSSGYSFQVETLLLAKKAGFRIKEVPIAFVDRTRGKSKMRLREVWEGSWRVLMLRFR
jgi:dolichol-phosphate mannosyltransferase